LISARVFSMPVPPGIQQEKKRTPEGSNELISRSSAAEARDALSLPRNPGRRVAVLAARYRASNSTQKRGNGRGQASAEASCFSAGGKDFLNVLGLSSTSTTFGAGRLAVLSKSAQTSSAADAAKQTVLVVDDDESMRTLLRRMLERTGFTVITAINGQDGMERFSEQPVDIVVTDMMMPVLDGVELIRGLRGKWPHVRIVAISGVEYPYLRMALGCGAQATLRKPVASTELVETLNRVLAAA
jgi:CheY-like chemotaxis protein